MSYDLDLFLSQPQIEPIITIQQVSLLRDTARTPLNIAVARHLAAENPNFETKATDDVFQIMDRVEGIQITLYAHSAQISIPLWFITDDIITVAFRTARQYILVIITHTGYSVYDPQLGRVIDLFQDLPLMITRYKQFVSGMQQFSG